MLRVSAGIIHRGGKILLCRRGEGGECAGLWEFPGGKREAGESAAACLVRECREELGIAVEPQRIAAQYAYAYPTREIHFTFFIARLVAGEPEASVHTALRWAAPGELASVSFCPADQAAASLIVNDSAKYF